MGFSSPWELYGVTGGVRVWGMGGGGSGHEEEGRDVGSSQFFVFCCVFCFIFLFFLLFLFSFPFFTCELVLVFGFKI